MFAWLVTVMSVSLLLKCLNAWWILERTFVGIIESNLSQERNLDYRMAWCEKRPNKSSSMTTLKPHKYDHVVCTPVFASSCAVLYLFINTGIGCSLPVWENYVWGKRVQDTQNTQWYPQVPFVLVPGAICTRYVLLAIMNNSREEWLSCLGVPGKSEYNCEHLSTHAYRM